MSKITNYAMVCPRCLSANVQIEACYAEQGSDAVSFHFAHGKCEREEGDCQTEFCPGDRDAKVTLRFQCNDCESNIPDRTHCISCRINACTFEVVFGANGEYVIDLCADSHRQDAACKAAAAVTP